MKKPVKLFTLRSFITTVICGTVIISLIIVGSLFYNRSAAILSRQYEKDISAQLNEINKQVEEKVKLVDSIYPLLMSNITISENLEPTTSTYHSGTETERRQDMEKQMSYLLYSTYLWNAGFINSVCIFDQTDANYSVFLNNKTNYSFSDIQKIYRNISDKTTLQIYTLEDSRVSIYFVRNIYSTYNGRKIATVIIDINQSAWKASYGSGVDDSWLIYLYNNNLKVVNSDELLPYAKEIDSSMVQGFKDNEVREANLEGTRFLLAKKALTTAGIYSVVAAPREQLFRDLNKVLRDYLLIITLLVMASFFLTILVSQLITAPIEKMIIHVKKISRGEKAELPKSMYREFNEFAEAFRYMLKQLDIYYRDNYQKKILLKNSELQALKAQMDPHFLFNVLDTVAWKAQMNDEEEIYQIIISLGELLRANTLSKENDFIPLKKELDYVRFYIYLQQVRFEDKFTASIQADASLDELLIPCFSIQPLVENAIIHGIEPKTGQGRLVINIIPTPDRVEISVSDNGVGFKGMPDISNMEASSEDSHTHIGLKNLNKRLELLYGPDSRLKVSSKPNIYTTISFVIPK